MNRSNDERLLDLRTLVRKRLERDLTLISQISAENNELSLRDILDEVHHVFVHYLSQAVLLDSAASSIHRDDIKLTEELNRLRSIDS